MYVSTGEMAQQLRALDNFPEDPGLIPGPTQWLITLCNSSSKGPMPSSGLLWYEAHRSRPINMEISHPYIKLGSGGARL